MSITSLSFIIFIFAIFTVYYILPKKWQWILLLVASIVFYLFSGVTSIVYIVVTAFSIFIATNCMQQMSEKKKAYLKENKAILSRNEKKLYKEKNKKQRKAILVCTLFLNFGLLGVFKYSHFFIDQINTILSVLNLGQVNNNFSLIVPLGISYYTLQATGYAVDVFWEKSKAEKNFFKVLLFVSFFPQITQGPISEFNYLSNELFKEHKLTYDNFSRGFQRMLWGFFKKMVIADTLSPYVTTILSDYKEYTGITCFVGALLYMAQLYADFSGYMDIMCGYCEMLDIRLTENFNRPFFSKSISEFWRRWHISLGAWLRTYVYYPVAISKWNQNLGKKSKKVFGQYFSDQLPGTVAMLFVWFSIGLWHDASWTYILWGLGNAFFIISSMWLEPIYKKAKSVLHIKEESFGFKFFQMVRTFIIFMGLEIIAAVSSLSGNGYEYVARILTNHKFCSLSSIVPISEVAVSNTSKMAFLLSIAGLFVMFVISILEEIKKVDLRDYFNKIPLFFRIFMFVLIFIVISIFGVQSSWGAGAFIYANF